MATVVQYPAKARRFSELGLLVIALAIGLGGYMLTSLGATDTIPENLGAYAGIFASLALATHLFIRRVAPYADPVLLPLAVAINGIGLAMIGRLDVYYAAAGLDNYVVGSKQLIMTLLGIALCWATLWLVRDHRLLRKVSYLAMIAAIMLLLLPLVPGIGRTINGARIWINIAGASFQPAELAKIALAVFFAGYLEYRRDSLAIAGRRLGPLRLPRGRDLWPILFVWAASVAVLVLQHDLGTALLVFALFVGMLYVATDRPSWIVIGAGLFVPAAVVAIKLFPHVASRFTVWLHAMDNEIFNREYGGSGQLVRGLFGMASGGLTGTGWAKGYPGIVPFANSDFIVASLGEELGFTGLAAILVMYLLLVARGMRAAIGVRDGFGKLLASGLSFTLAIQVFVVIGGVTRLIPLTGLTTPFLAYGGSSLVANWIMLGLLLRISDAARRPEGAIKAAPAALPLADATPAAPSDLLTERVKLQ